MIFEYSLILYSDFDMQVIMHITGGRKQRIWGLEVECGDSSVDRVMVSIEEHSNVHIKI